MSCGGQKFRTVLEEPEFLGTERLLLTDTLLLGISIAVVLSLQSQGELPVPDSEGKNVGIWGKIPTRGGWKCCPPSRCCPWVFLTEVLGLGPC